LKNLTLTLFAKIDPVIEMVSLIAVESGAKSSCRLKALKEIVK